MEVPDDRLRHLRQPVNNTGLTRKERQRAWVMHQQHDSAVRRNRIEDRTHLFPDIPAHGIPNRDRSDGNISGENTGGPRAWTQSPPGTTDRSPPPDRLQRQRFRAPVPAFQPQPPAPPNRLCLPSSWSPMVAKRRVRRLRGVVPAPRQRLSQGGVITDAHKGGIHRKIPADHGEVRCRVGGQQRVQPVIARHRDPGKPDPVAPRQASPRSTGFDRPRLESALGPFRGPRVMKIRIDNHPLIDPPNLVEPEPAGDPNAAEPNRDFRATVPDFRYKPAPCFPQRLLGRNDEFLTCWKIGHRGARKCRARRHPRIPVQGRGISTTSALLRKGQTDHRGYPDPGDPHLRHPRTGGHRCPEHRTLQDPETLEKFCERLLLAPDRPGAPISPASSSCSMKPRRPCWK